MSGIIGMNARLQYSFLYCIFLAVLPGCAKKIGKKWPLFSSSKNTKVSSVNNYQEIIALHSEIPDPMLGFVVDSVVHDVSDQQIVEIVYKPIKSTQAINQDDIKQSYLADMELLGWRHIGEFASGSTMQFLFERPKSNILCSIYVQSDGITRVTLLGKKEGLL